MNRSTLRRTGAVAALTCTLSLGLAACGQDTDSSENSSTDSTDSSSSESSSPMESGSGSSGGSDGGAQGASADTFGPGCSAIPKSGAGSFNGMATEPVATAASANPLLKTLVTAVKKADLVDTLNSAKAVTVFAPTNDAFGKVPEGDLNKLLQNKPELTKVLTHHVVEGKISPDKLAGTHKTMAGDTIKVTGAKESFTVSGDQSKVLCGNIPTANATVYVVDTVLMPK